MVGRFRVSLCPAKEPTNRSLERQRRTEAIKVGQRSIQRILGCPSLALQALMDRAVAILSAKRRSEREAMRHLR